METVQRLHPMDGYDNINRAQEEHGAGIFCLAHFGNWDMAATMALSHGLALTTVMREFTPVAFNRVIVWARERRGLEVFTPGRAARGLLHALRRGRFLALLADIPEGGPTVEVRFRAAPSSSTRPAVMALHRRSPSLPCACYRDGRHYRILVDAPIPTGTVAEMTQALAERLDALIALAPDRGIPSTRCGRTRASLRSRHDAGPGGRGPAQGSVRCPTSGRPGRRSWRTRSRMTWRAPP